MLTPPPPNFSFSQQSDKAAAGFFDNYHTLDEFFDWMASLQKDYPDLVTPKAIGKSLEGRSISGITITSKKNTTGASSATNTSRRDENSHTRALLYLNC